MERTERADTNEQQLGGSIFFRNRNRYFDSRRFAFVAIIDTPITLVKGRSRGDLGEIWGAWDQTI
jgi:hypothetical protein